MTEIINEPITVLLNKVMKEVQPVAKTDRNVAQNFNFRGIDAVVNAVSPALKKYGVIVIPNVVTYDYSSVEVGIKRTQMGHARLTVEYSFYGPMGDFLTTCVASEAMDSGDKATAKAMSVAFRIALLQALALPTDEADPDHDTYERSAPIKLLTDAELDQLSLEVNSIQTVDKLREVYASNKLYLAQTLIDGNTLDALFKSRATQLTPVKEEVSSGA